MNWGRCGCWGSSLRRQPSPTRCLIGSARRAGAGAAICCWTDCADPLATHLDPSATPTHKPGGREVCPEFHPLLFPPVLRLGVSRHKLRGHCLWSIPSGVCRARSFLGHFELSLLRGQKCADSWPVFRMVKLNSGSLSLRGDTIVHITGSARCSDEIRVGCARQRSLDASAAVPPLAQGVDLGGQERNSPETFWGQSSQSSSFFPPFTFCFSSCPWDLRNPEWAGGPADKGVHPALGPRSQPP